MKKCLIAIALILAGCKDGIQFEPSLFIQKQNVPIPIPCIVKIDPVPDYPDTKEKIVTLPLSDQVKALLSARTLREAWEPQALAALDGCSKLPAALSPQSAPVAPSTVAVP